MENGAGKGSISLKGKRGSQTRGSCHLLRWIFRINRIFTVQSMPKGQECGVLNPEKLPKIKRHVTCLTT